MRPSFTVRIDGDILTVSSDDGRTARLVDGDDIANWQAWFEAIADDLRFGSTPAAALAAFAEAAEARPVERRGAVGRTSGASPPTSPEAKSSSTERVAIGGYAVSDSTAMLLAARQSSRAFGTVSIEAVAGVIVDACRVLAWNESDDGYQRTFCPFPSAGGRHPIDVYLLAQRVTGLRPGCWRFDGVRCELVAQPIPTESTLSAVRAALGLTEDPPALLVLVADFDRTLSRYPAGSTLVWRDAGVAAGTIHLLASARGLASTIVGTANTFAAPIGGLAGDVGAIALGGRLCDE